MRPDDGGGYAETVSMVGAMRLEGEDEIMARKRKLAWYEIEHVPFRDVHYRYENMNTGEIAIGRESWDGDFESFRTMRERLTPACRVIEEVTIS